MPGLRDAIRWDTETGPPVQAGEVTVTPRAKVLVVQTPAGGFVWNRPVAVDVERAGQVEQRRIYNVTGIAQATLMAVSILFSLLAFGMTLEQRRDTSGR